MRTDFTPENVDIWIDNYKRKDLIGSVAESWLNSFPFDVVNVIVNHSSVVEEDFPENIRPRVKLWKNVMRHDMSRGPINKNINQAYIHTFLSGKKYCVVVHDSYTAEPGWADCVIKSPQYDFYSAPQGDGFHIQTLKGLQTYGWWDERYGTMGWHEIDYLTRVFRSCYILKNGCASIVDIHHIWPKHLPFVSPRGEMIYKSVGLEKFVRRLPRESVPSIGAHDPAFKIRAEAFHLRKWKSFDAPGGTMENIKNGPQEQDVDFYPWLDLANFTTDRCEVK